MENILWLGIDIGSTTVKAVVLEPVYKNVLYKKYIRHNAKTTETVLEIFFEIKKRWKEASFKCAICGSGGMDIANHLGANFIQEVVANAIAVKERYPMTKVAIELGGQDAKIIFFHHDELTGEISVSDMRMNGSCAGGTGAFIDQIAELLSVCPEEFGILASKGKTVYDVSGRCGVFAKTDIQPLLNQGASKADIALSTFHAIAKQTIGGLAQGTEITAPVLFEGGPLTFHPRLVEAYVEKLNLKSGEAIIPENAETLVAIGSALSIGTMFRDSGIFDIGEAIEKLRNGYELLRRDGEGIEKFFATDKEKEDFYLRHQKEERALNKTEKNLDVYLGVDAGSTTSKFVLLDENEEIVDSFYRSNSGDPIAIISDALIEMREKYKKAGISLNVKGMGTTGYGEILFSKAFSADYHTVETVAHAHAAKKLVPGVSFILDIGGQDMKAIYIKNGVVTGIILNEACSAGCGSFIETYAKSLNVPVGNIAEMAFHSENPSKLGSRCTVFMNSSIITEQKSGKTIEDIMAGLCRSIIENVFTKVIRISNFDLLGEKIVVQGGTFKNDAVLRAMEQYINKKVIRPDHPGEMGAIGIAMLTKKYIEEKGEGYQSTFLGLDRLEECWNKKEAGNACKFCTNGCSRTIVRFSNGDSYVTGNRCEKGEILGDLEDEKVREKLKDVMAKKKEVPDLMKERNELLFRAYNHMAIEEKKNITIGIPRVLEFWNSFPFWNTFFGSLGFSVVLSDESSYRMFENGLPYVPSDTVCFPGKIVHGHIENLVEKKVDRIFYPYMMEIPSEHTNGEKAYNMCAVVQGYPVIIKVNNEPEKKHGIVFDTPMFRWYNKRLRDKQLVNFMQSTFGIKKEHILKGIELADHAMFDFQSALMKKGEEVIELVKQKDTFAVVLAGRPYHGDSLINHELSSHFTKLGVPVLTIDSIPGIFDTDLSNVMADIVNPFHTRLFSAAIAVAKSPYLEMAQIVSFGCGHDAINTDEVNRIMEEVSGKEALVLKLDEGDAKGPLVIRIKSFIETVKERRKKTLEVRELEDPFQVKFKKEDIKKRVVYVPNLSEAFSVILTAVMEREGLEARVLPIAGKRAKELGKKYVHNDICYPAQINIGEMLAELENCDLNKEKIAFGLAKNCDGCRAGQYLMLARRALDEFGYKEIPLLTTDMNGNRAHPGFKVSLAFQLRTLTGIAVMDALEDMRRKIRPYEKNNGETDEVFFRYVNRLAEALKKRGKNVFDVLEEAVTSFNDIPCDRSERKPRVLIIGEILMNYHKEANENIEAYLEKNGMETILPPYVDFFRRDNIKLMDGAKRDYMDHGVLTYILGGVTDAVYKNILGKVEKRMQGFRYFEKRASVHELSKIAEEYIDSTYTPGEGWLILAEIIENARCGVNAFAIVQPFACLPNHISGRGLIKAMKEKNPKIQIVSLDYDPDTSYANIENRLQMLIMASKEEKKNPLDSIQGRVDLASLIQKDTNGKVVGE